MNTQPGGKMPPSPKLVVFTGAGISADSGVQTFRDSDGLWENHRVEQVATLSTWKANFNLVHSFYNARRAQLPLVQPNEAHKMVARLQSKYPTTLLTQNVDDLHERGGATDVIHLHGDLRRMRCLACGHRWEIGYACFEPGVDTCPNVRKGTPCGSKKGVKPDVVFFGEGAPRYFDMHRAIEALDENDVLLVIGTSGKVIDIGTMALRSKAHTILSNLESAKETWSPVQPVAEDRHFKHVLHGRASEVAHEIEKLVSEILG